MLKNWSEEQLDSQSDEIAKLIGLQCLSQIEEAMDELGRLHIELWMLLKAQ